jgi:nucleotide-binding universal stress UspA family protein
VETIITAAREGEFDLLVVGFVGHSNVFGRVMGGTTQNLSRLSPCSILIVK